MYRFGVAGQFPIHIDASNHYNNKSVNMCPVLVYERSYSTCHLGLASAINSSYSDPIVRYRSDDIYFEQLAVSSCGDILYWIKIDGKHRQGSLFEIHVFLIQRSREGERQSNQMFSFVCRLAPLSVRYGVGVGGSWIVSALVLMYVVIHVYV